MILTFLGTYRPHRVSELICFSLTDGFYSCFRSTTDGLNDVSMMMETFPRSQVLSKLIIDGKYEKYLEIFTARPAANDFVFL